MSSRLGKKVVSLLTKSREAAILAVEIYNKPQTQFKTHGYIVLMTIAWTSLLQAFFEKKGISYYDRNEKNGRYIYVDGDKKAWDISRCIAEYYGSLNSPEKENIKFIVGLRNKIEHRFLPALDIEVFGECHALLINYEKFVLSEFGERYSINDSLSVPLQALSVIPDWRKQVIKELQSREYGVVKNYINVYRDSLDPSVWDNNRYSFRVFLIPKLGNRQQSSDVAVEFVQYDQANAKDMESYQRVAAFIKQKQVPVLNPHLFKPLEVCKKVKSALNIDAFEASSHHVKCWKHFEVRPSSGSPTPEKTNNKYCHYDVPHKDYLYTQEWIDLLINALSDPVKKEEILSAS